MSKKFPKEKAVELNKKEVKEIFKGHTGKEVEKELKKRGLKDKILVIRGAGFSEDNDYLFE